LHVHIINDGQCSEAFQFADNKISCLSHKNQAWAHNIFTFLQDRKKFEISGHFSRHQSHKNAFFVISGAYNFETFRAEAKITIRRHEVV